MELGSIEREIYVDASREVVFEVVSSPEHVSRWWSDEAHYQPSPGSQGEIVFRAKDGLGETSWQFAVVDVDPPELFSFRWTHPAGEQAVSGNSLLVTFTLTPSGSGTLLKMTESGFREMGWELAKLEQQYQAHVSGWDMYVPRIAPYAASLGVKS